MIEVKELEFNYPLGENKIPVLQGINLTVNKGEFIALLGANGSGKSTLARHLNGLLKPVEGSILVDGIDTQDTDKTDLIRKKVGYLFQNPENQLVAPTVGEDVAFGPENYCISSDEIKKRVEEALGLVGMQQYFHQPIQFLSGGQKQCVALAGLLAIKPDYLILDEPTSMLDPLGKKIVLEVVRKLKSEGYAIIYITHHMDEALLADRIVVLEKGQVVYNGSPSKVLVASESTNLNLQIPPFYRLLDGLKQGGIHIPDDILTIDELVNYLCS